MVCYECKKLGHFIFECPSLNKEKPRKTFKKKKSLMATWKDLDFSSFEEEEEVAEEANL